MLLLILLLLLMMLLLLKWMLMASVTRLFLDALCDILKRDCTLDILAREDCLLFPFHKYLKIRWHSDHGSCFYRIECNPQIKPVGAPRTAERGYLQTSSALCNNILYEIVTSISKKSMATPSAKRQWEMDNGCEERDQREVGRCK